MFTVIDFKGTKHTLHSPVAITCSEKGLTEMWFDEGRDWILNYRIIVVPVFEDWWVDPQWETHWN